MVYTSIQIFACAFLFNVNLTKKKKVETSYGICMYVCDLTTKIHMNMFFIGIG